MVTTSKGGPSTTSISKRTIRDIHGGKVIDECEPEDAPDIILHRELATLQGNRVVVQVRNAERMFTKAGPDVAEVSYPIRVVHGAGMQRYM